MNQLPTYNSVHPIGDTDPLNLPVPDAERAVPYYEEQLGFTVGGREETPVRRLTLRRDGITISLVENGGDPEQASCYLAVSDVDAARAELAERGAAPGEIRVDNYGGSSYRVFFVRDPVGLCYCIGQKEE